MPRRSYRSPVGQAPVLRPAHPDYARRLQEAVFPSDGGPGYVEIELDLSAIAQGWHVSEEMARERYRRGTDCSGPLEDHVKHNLSLPVGGGGNDPFDLYTPDLERCELRTLTQRGVCFRPSIQTGGGQREFDEEAFLDRVSGLNRYIVCDIDGFPRVRVYSIPAAVIADCWREGLLNTTGELNYGPACELLDSLCRRQSAMQAA